MMLRSQGPATALDHEVALAMIGSEGMMRAPRIRGQCNRAGANAASGSERPRLSCRRENFDEAATLGRRRSRRL